MGKDGPCVGLVRIQGRHYSALNCGREGYWLSRVRPVFPSTHGGIKYKRDRGICPLDPLRHCLGTGDRDSSGKLWVRPWYCPDFRYLDERRHLAKAIDRSSVPHDVRIKLPLLFASRALIFTIVRIGFCERKKKKKIQYLGVKIESAVPAQPGPFTLKQLSHHNNGEISQ